LLDPVDGDEIPSMTRETLLAEILRLPPEERIDLLGDAWDAIAASPDEVPMPAWHVEVLEKRLAEPEPEYLSWEEVRERLKETL
jgi:putative addiction module component (TIGR02574 family)